MKQITMNELAVQVYGEESEDYKGFVDKFKPKKTSDDCYTPALVYDAVLEYCIKRYGVRAGDVIRPFYPGGDYENREYPPGCVVIDNPPFSIISKIARLYMQRGVRFFLFAPYLSNLNTNIPGITHVIAPTTVRYENGAEVATTFLTNMEPGVYARADSELAAKIKAADAENRRESGRRSITKYAYPNEVLTATMLGYMATHGVDLTILESETHHIRALDSQRRCGKGIFGSGVLLSKKAAAEKAAAEKAAAEKAAAEKAAAEKAAAIVWELSEREREIIARLGGKYGKKDYIGIHCGT